jgi:hypothetical protein
MFLDWIWQTYFVLQMLKKLQSGKATNTTTIQRQDTDAGSWWESLYDNATSGLSAKETIVNLEEPWVMIVLSSKTPNANLADAVFTR